MRNSPTRGRLVAVGEGRGGVKQKGNSLKRVQLQKIWSFAGLWGSKRRFRLLGGRATGRKLKGPFRSEKLF